MNFGLFFYLQKPRPLSGIKLIGLCDGTMNCSHIFAFKVIDGFIGAEFSFIGFFYEGIFY
jgi:hypothetical protein